MIRNSVLVYVALGGNIGNVQATFKEVLENLRNHFATESLKVSSFYQTLPIDVESTEWFTNAVCCFYTTLKPAVLFRYLEALEKKLGKTAKPKNSSRLIDLDLLFYGSLKYEKEGLSIPHLHWMERLFVLIPLKDLTDQITIESQTYDITDLIIRAEAVNGYSTVKKII